MHTRERLFRMLPLVVRGQSMEPTYWDGSLIWGAGQPSQLSRGDVVILRVPEASRRRDIKRVIGLPGESVAWNGQGQMWIDGILLEEPYARFGSAVPGDDDVQSITLRDDEYFVAGDHRLHSRDSRRYGAVRREQLMERVQRR